MSGEKDKVCSRENCVTWQEKINLESKFHFLHTQICLSLMHCINCILYSHSFIYFILFYILIFIFLFFLYFPSKRRWVEKKTRCVPENEKSNLERNFHFWLSCMHLILHFCIRTIKRKSAKWCLHFNEKSRDKRQKAKANDVTWQQEDQSEKQFPFHAHLLQFCLSSLHCILHLYIRAIKSKYVKWRPLLNFK